MQMTDLFYMVVLAVAIAVFVFTGWVAYEGLITWNLALWALTVIALGIATIFHAWRNDK